MFTMTLSICFLYGALVSFSKGDSEPCKAEQCSSNAPHAGSVLLQKKSLLGQTRLDLDEEKFHEDDANLHAQFLIQATFGPTTKSMKELESSSYEDWIKSQMALPMSSHREHYRAHVNPHWSPYMYHAGQTKGVGGSPQDDPHYFYQLPACNNGSRWTNYALRSTDEGKYLVLRDGQMLTVNRNLQGKPNLKYSQWKTDIDPAANGVKCSNEAPPNWAKSGQTCTKDLGMTLKFCRRHDWRKQQYCKKTCSDLGSRHGNDDCTGGWAAFAKTEAAKKPALICKVLESTGGVVQLSKEGTCPGSVFMVNPQVHLSDASKAVKTNEKVFETKSNLADTLFLNKDLAQKSCGLSDTSTLVYRGKYFRHDPRMGLLDNTGGSPQTTRNTSCPRRSFVNEASCQLQPPNAQGCTIACGSPGEIGNIGQKGHYFSMWTRTVDPHYVNGKRVKGVGKTDKVLDSSYYNTPWLFRLSKTVVWTTHALYAKDQLRQRMAFSLAQIHVISQESLAKLKDHTEPWVHYYDIFVRHAFGSFRDLLREVTYSPMMGAYLSYTGSKSYETSQSFPDENYAREVMQLFTVGPDLLNNDGSPILDEMNVSIPTYTNEHIMNFARVFTGFHNEAPRGNMEVVSKDNVVDPMAMSPIHHDKFPKPDLFGGFLGDGYPLCSDLPKDAFRAKGARYEFLGYSHQGPFHKIVEGSGLFEALKSFSLTVTLGEDMACAGQECSIKAVDGLVFKVRNGFYEYVAPPCVHLFVSGGHSTVLAQTPSKTQFEKCVDPNSAAGFACCGGCTDTIPGWFRKKKLSCATATTLGGTKNTMFKKWCNKSNSWRKAKYCTYTCWKHDKDWQNQLAYEGTDCSAGEYKEIMHCGGPQDAATFASAQEFCKKKSMSVCAKPKGKCAKTAKYLWTGRACSASIQVHSDGQISGGSKNAQQNRFPVHWKSGIHPGDGIFDAIVKVTPVFKIVPMKKELLDKLKIGAFAPATKCTHSCGEEVEAYAVGKGDIDQSTIFKCGGSFYKNSESVVHVNGVSFRNPPMFMPPAEFSAAMSERALRRAALAEVESLLDHLVFHPNTPVNIGRKLIQRFVSSNPSPAYLEAVADAFKAGAFGDMKFSGKYGDLGATLAAILLHPEGRTQSGKSNGLLREPLLKIMHLLRSMDYADNANDPVVIGSLADKLGQFPYDSPTVFNFYNDDFVPGFNTPDGKADPEALVGPEFQIFTAPNIMNFLNGLTKVVEQGISFCGSWGVRAPLRSTGCITGQLNYSAASTPEEAVKEMNLMLTGGRLTPTSMKVVKDAFEGAAEGKKIQAAQKAILLTPEFHTLGESATSGTRQPKLPKPPSPNLKPYKAVVMLYMAGGADTWNMLVPRDCSLHDDYAAVRKGIEIPIADLLPIKADGQKCGEFGINPSMPKLHKLYEDKQAAFVSNVGALVKPTTRESLRGGASRLCPGQFSHSLAMQVAQSTECRSVSTPPRGIGGLMADELGKKNMKAQSFSVMGAATWSKGVDTVPQILSRDGGSVTFREYDIWKDALGNITSEKRNNVYCDNYAQTVSEALKSTEEMKALLEGVKSTSLDSYNTEGTLQKQLYQVARVIATREARKAERDFFYVMLGGWDTHGNIKTVLPEKLKVVDDAVASFVAELQHQRIFESVVLVTSSDFGRSLSFNGAGTDHGWGGNAFVVGGGINGGRIFNDFLETYQTDTEYIQGGRARVIPKYPWESVMVPIAEWVGVDNPEDIFPNLANFNRSQHIIGRDVLFKSTGDEPEKPAPIPEATEAPTTPEPTSPATTKPPTPEPTEAAATTAAPTEAPTTPAAVTTAAPTPATYYKMDKGSCCCPEGQQIATRKDCEKAHDALGIDHNKVWRGKNRRIPSGCSTRQRGKRQIMFWNVFPKGRANKNLTPICKKV